MFTKIAVLGLGKVGRLAAELLVGGGFDVIGLDTRPVPGAPFRSMPSTSPTRAR